MRNNNALEDDFLTLQDEEDEIQTFSYLKSENSDDILQMYLKDIGKKKILKPDEETEIAKMIKEGNMKQSKLAKDKLIQSNLRLVVSIAK